MAKYSITHSCGHEATHNLTGPVKDRQPRADYLATTLCTDCYRAEQLAKAKAANTDLPALTGSDKQIAWAESIRAGIISAIDTLIAQGTANRAAMSAEHLAAFEASCGDAAQIKAHTSAAWWIDHRSTDGVSLLREVGRARLARKA